MSSSPFNVDPETTSVSLLNATCQGCSLATSKLYRIYFPLCYSWARQLGLQEADADDISQQVMLKALDSLHLYSRARGRFRNWLWVVLKNTVTDFGRRCGRQAKSYDARFFDQLQQTPIDASSSQMPLLIAKQALLVMEDQLTPRTFAVVREILLNQRPAGDVAKEFGMTTGAVYTAQSRALKKIRAALQGLE